MYSSTEYATASELRYILSVVEERSHLGLDTASAQRIREVLVRRIADAENSSAKKNPSSVAIAVEKLQFLAQ